MNVSVVICTRNRATQLEAALEYWLKIKSTLIWEMTVVDNGSTDQTCQVLEKFREKFAQRLHYIYEPLPGLGRARNRGWRASQGDIILFTDDDCYPAPDLIDATWTCFAEQERLGFIGGRILLHDPTDYPITIQESTIRKSIRPHSFVKPGLIQGANMACRRSAIVEVKGLDNRLGAGTLFPIEDADLIARMSAAGWRGAYDPRPLVYHHHRRKTKAEADRLQIQYAWGRGAYYAKGIFSPKMSFIFTVNWLIRIPRQKPRITLIEMRSFLKFLSQNMTPRTEKDIAMEGLS